MSPSQSGSELPVAVIGAAPTSFANPAVTLARGFTTTFAGIAMNHVPAFVIAQLVGACLGAAVAAVLFNRQAAHA